MKAEAFEAVEQSSLGSVALDEGRRRPSRRRATAYAARRRGREERARTRSPSRIRAIVTAITVAAHVPFAFAAAEGARLLGLTNAPLWGFACAAVLALFAPLYLSRFHPDRPRSAFGLWAVELPYYAHWCAAFAGAAPTALYGVGATLAGLVGFEPMPVGRFALAVYAGLFAVAAWGVFGRRWWTRVRELDIALPDLPLDLDGYRIVHLSDLHIGGLTPASWAERWVRIANRLDPDLVAVTGDLVTHGTAFHGEIARVVGALRAKDGVFVSMGNHDYFGDGEQLVRHLESAGPTVLRNRSQLVVRGDTRFTVAGIEDTWSGRADPARALAEADRGEVTIVLAHEPNLFDAAARLGADLVLAGHTHGGQVALPFFARRVSLGRLTHERHLGLYRKGNAFLHVHPGLGTTGVPMRLGVAPEITLIRLRAREATEPAAVRAGLCPRPSPV